MCVYNVCVYLLKCVCIYVYLGSVVLVVLGLCGCLTGDLMTCSESPTEVLQKAQQLRIGKYVFMYVCLYICVYEVHVVAFFK